MKLVSSFGERLKEAMTLRGVRAVDISNNTNISKPLLSNYIRGRYKPKQEAIMKIAKYLKVSEVWLIGYDDCDMDRYTPNFDGVKREIVDMLNELSINDLEKIKTFIQDYFIDRK